MNTPTFREYIETLTDDTLRGEIQSVKSRAESLAGRSFSDVQVKSIDTMGDAAGCCEMCTKEISIRSDIISSVEAVRDMLLHVLLHEHVHSQGVHSDGLAEVIVNRMIGVKAVPAYAQKFEHAGHVMNEIGLERAQKLASAGKEGNVLMAEAIFVKRAQGARTIEAVRQAARGAVELVKKAG